MTLQIMEVPPVIRVPDMKRFFGIDKDQALYLLRSGNIKGSRPATYDKKRDRVRRSKFWYIDTASVREFFKRAEVKTDGILKVLEG